MAKGLSDFSKDLKVEMEVFVLAAVGAAKGELQSVTVIETELFPYGYSCASLSILLNGEVAILERQNGTIVAHQ